MSGESEFGRYLARLRREAGKSQRRLAEALCDVSGRDTVTRHEVSRWERGGRVPTSWLSHLATVLGVPLDGLERVLANSTRYVDGSPEPSPQLTLSDLLPQSSAWQPDASGRRIGKEAAEHLASRAHALRLADDVVPSHDLVTPAFRELRAAVRLFRQTSHSEEISKVLLSSIGEPEEAAKTASHMLDLAEDFPSERTAERGRVVLTKLEPYRQDVSEVRDLFDRHSAA